MASASVPPPRKLKAAILGATGTVGQRFITLLAAHPFFEIHALCASPRSAGRAYANVVNWKLPADIPSAFASLVVERCDVVAGSRLAECDVAFSGLDSGVAGEIEAAVARSGIPVFSNAKNFRMHPSVPLVVPTANPHHLAPMVRAQLAHAQGVAGLVPAPQGVAEIPRPGGYIVTNSNCSTTGLVTVLRALIDAFGEIDAVQVATLQAVSGAGYPGLPVLDVFDNIVPFIDGEEDKLETEPQKILGTIDPATSHVNEVAGMTVSASCNRVPVLDGHTLNVAVRFADRSKPRPTPAQIAEVLAQYVPSPAAVMTQCPSFPAAAIHVSPLKDRPQPRLDRDRGNGMTVTVGRIREDNLLDVKFVSLTHNTVLGAAGSSLLNAEIAVVEGVLRARA
ncbi:aspartate-semialdehyde dehydrogenase [Blastocladiella emersonii ATCC 22665]|nr:aspartate-semialdehyde dehydrogenase [Blastocladiella emersonii ATCC 22665]